MTNLSYGYIIQNDITDPTPYEEPDENPVVAESFISGKEIHLFDDIIYLHRDGSHRTDHDKVCFVNELNEDQIELIEKLDYTVDYTTPAEAHMDWL